MSILFVTVLSLSLYFYTPDFLFLTRFKCSDKSRETYYFSSRIEVVDYSRGFISSPNQKAIKLEIRFYSFIVQSFSTKHAV